MADKQPAVGSLKQADRTSNPVPNDAESNDPPVRTNRPDVEIIGSLAVGAGQHHGRTLDHEVDGVAVDADGFDYGGRYIGQPKATKK